MEIKICKTMAIEYEGKMFVQVKMTFLGYLLRNSWTVCQGDFEREFKDMEIPCYMNLRTLLKQLLIPGGKRK